MNDYRDRGHLDGPATPPPSSQILTETAALALALAPTPHPPPPTSWAGDLARVSVGEVSSAGRVWSVSCRA